MTEPSRILAHARDAAHVAEGLALVITQLRGKAAFEAVLSSWLTQVQAVEDALWGLYALAIDNSSAHALDQLGALLGQPRPVNLGDVPYRKVLHAATIALTSSGTGDELLAAMHALIGSWDFTMALAFPATVLFEPDEASDVPAAVMASVLRRVKSGGVGLQVVDVPSGDVFAFAAGEVPETDVDTGFSDTGGLVGGQLVGVVT